MKFYNQIARLLNMYGTIANLNIKNGHEQQLIDLFNSTEKAPGQIAWLLMNPDNQKEWIGIAVFESKDVYFKNAERPETNKMYENFIKHLETEPTWTDGEYVITNI
tara:strand:- start:10490 stop:10807 length:318 start_codon:yes stop_codon:yes gene_type:complete